MKIKNTHLKKALATLALIMTTVCHITTQTAYAWDDDSDTPFSETTIVRFGLFDKQTGQIEYSQPDYFFDHFKYGLAHSIYNSVYYEFHDNANMQEDVGLFWEELEELLGTQFFSVLSSQRYLMNVLVSRVDDYLWVNVLLNRTPGGSDYPFYNVELNSENKYLFEIGPSGYKSGAWVFTINSASAGRGLSNFAPYYTRTFENIPTYPETTIDTSFNSVSTFPELVTRLSQANTRSAMFRFRVSVPDCHIIENSLMSFIYCSYVNSFSPQGFSFNITANQSATLKTVMCDFPIYENYEDNFNTPNIYPAGSTQAAVNTRINISRIYERFQRDVPPFKISALTPILISGYDEIPAISPTPTPSVMITATPALATATPTPTALPTITLAPSPTPSGVSPIEGVETMFSLFTRRYDINIMGVTVGIRPFFLFVGCFVVGSVITMIQGGNKS